MKQTVRQASKYDPNRETTWCVQDQPANKLVNMGPRALTDTELLASLLTGTSDATGIARRLFHMAGHNLNTLSRFSVEQLVTTKGVTGKRAAAILAALELGRRMEYPADDLKQIKSSETVNKVMVHISDLPHEEFWVMCLNRANRMIGKHKISQGGISGTVIDTRIILRKALDSSAVSMILCHNHPSGSIKPSDADIKITEKVKNAAEIMELKVLDHVIVSTKGYFSFADEGLL